MARTNYLNNNDLMTEIHKSKSSFCYFVDPKFKNYDTIIDSLDEITSDKLIETRELRAERLVKEKKHRNKMKEIKETLDPIDPETIPFDDVVFRLMTVEHIPVDELKLQKIMDNNKERAYGDDKVKLNFPPFKHYHVKSWDLDNSNRPINLEIQEVGRSHWVNGLENGHFSVEQGKITDKLALMFMKFVDRYGSKANWRGYSYIDEMKGQALCQLSYVGLQFNEAKSSNPFSYYTETVKNSFTRVLNVEKKNQNIRDDLLIANNQAPSHTRQLDDEKKQQDEAKGIITEKPKRGRPKKNKD